MLNSKLTRLAKNLLIGSTLTLMVACSSQQKPVPVKPQIQVVRVNDQMCMSLQDGKKLGFYILELERGY